MDRQRVLVIVVLPGAVCGNRGRLDLGLPCAAEDLRALTGEEPAIRRSRRSTGSAGSSRSWPPVTSTKMTGALSAIGRREFWTMRPGQALYRSAWLPAVPGASRAARCHPPGRRSAFGRAGDHPARHGSLLIEVIARANTVVAVSDPQGDPLDQQHRGQILAQLDFVEVGGDF